MKLDKYKKLNKERIEQGERELAAKEIRCACGKLLCKLSKSGRILVWCKECHKEVELEVEPYEPDKMQGKNRRIKKLIDL